MGPTLPLGYNGTWALIIYGALAGGTVLLLALGICMIYVAFIKRVNPPS